MVHVGSICGDENTDIQTPNVHRYEAGSRPQKGQGALAHMGRGVKQRPRPWAPEGSPSRQGP